jgi:GTPase SAR1 family protein
VLSDATTGERYNSSNLLILGAASAGKRTLLNSLAEHSTTKFYYKKNMVQNSKLGLKGQTSILDYGYLRVDNVDDPEDDPGVFVECLVLDDMG